MFLSNPELELESYSVKRYQDTVIITGDVSKKSISDIVIIDSTAEKNDRLISANLATLTESSAQAGVISLELDNVFSHTPDSARRNDYEYFTADKMTYNILLSDISISISQPGPREMSSIDVYRAIREKKSVEAVRVAEITGEGGIARYELHHVIREAAGRMRANGTIPGESLRRVEIVHSDLVKLLSREYRDLTIRTYEIEYYKKFSLPVGCVVFVFFAFPVGLLTRRSGRAVGFGIGLFVTIVYFGLLFAGQTLGVRLNFSPFISMWFPNILVLFVSSVIFVIRIRK